MLGGWPDGGGGGLSHCDELLGRTADWEAKRESALRTMVLILSVTKVRKVSVQVSVCSGLFPVTGAHARAQRSGDATHQYQSHYRPD